MWVLVAFLTGIILGYAVRGYHEKQNAPRKPKEDEDERRY